MGKVALVASSWERLKTSLKREGSIHSSNVPSAPSDRPGEEGLYVEELLSSPAPPSMQWPRSIKRNLGLWGQSLPGVKAAFTASKQWPGEGAAPAPGRIGRHQHAPRGHGTWPKEGTSFLLLSTDRLLFQRSWEGPSYFYLAIHSHSTLFNPQGHTILGEFVAAYWKRVRK